MADSKFVVVNKERAFISEALPCSQALSLYDSKGGAAAGYLVVNQEAFEQDSSRFIGSINGALEMSVADFEDAYALFSGTAVTANGKISDKDLLIFCNNHPKEVERLQDQFDIAAGVLGDLAEIINSLNKFRD